MSVQLRLGFSEPTRPVHMMLRGVGGRVLVTCESGSDNDAYAYLNSGGAGAEMSSATGLWFPVSRIRALGNLPSQVSYTGDDALAPLLSWLRYPPAAGTDVELEAGPDGSLWLRWSTATGTLIEPVTSDGAVALISADIPFLAAEETFDRLLSVCQLPMLLGRLSANRAGFVEITTSKPQMVENSGLTGLFRIDETHYGLPLPRLGELEGRRGFAWDGQVPRPEPAPLRLPPLPIGLSEHAATDLRPLVDALAAYRTQLVVWGPGLGRRVFVLAALEVLDAYPALVVCGPERLWQWWRHAHLFGRDVSVSDPACDLRLITYNQFAAHPEAGFSATAVLLDNITGKAASAPEVTAAMATLGGSLDGYLVGLANRLPSEPRELVRVMSALRPAEFTFTGSLTSRYGVDSATRLMGHVDSYVSRRDAQSPGTDSRLSGFSHAQVQVMDLPEQLRREYDDLGRRHPSPADRIAAQTALCTTGSKFALSPKYAAAVDLVTEAVQAGRRAAVVTDNPQVAASLRAMLIPQRPALWEFDHGQPQPDAPLCLLLGSGVLPSLATFDDVVVFSYPVSFTDLDVALGVDPRPGQRVTCLHVRDSIDDEFAVLAARNAESGTRLRLHPDLLSGA